MPAYRHARSSSSSSISEKELPAVPLHQRALFRFSDYCHRLVRYWWAWQFLAAFISVAAAIALIILLVAANRHPQQSFQVGAYQLSLNTVVAAIATILRTSLLVTVAGALNQSTWNWYASHRHDAKLGPGRPLKDLDTFGDAASDSWSSLKLLWRTKLRTLASIGASISVLSLAFDTFAQSVLSLDVQSVEVSNDGPSSVPSLHRVISYTRVFDGAIAAQAPLGVTNALMAGVFNTSTPPAVTCPVDDCSWPVTPTLAVCSSCTDATSLITKNISEQYVEYSLSLDGAALTNPGFSNFLSTDPSILFEPHTSLLNVSVLQGAQSNGNDFLTSFGQLPIAQLFYLGIPSTRKDAFIRSFYGNTLNLSQIEPWIVAYNCTFTFCLQSFQANTRQHVARESVVSSWDTMKVLRPFSENMFNYDGLWGFTNIPTSMNIDNASAYTVDQGSYESLASAFTDSFGGNVSYDPTTDATIIQNVPQSMGGSTMPVFLNASSSLASMSALCKNIADGLTTHMRTSLAAAPDLRYAPTLRVNQTVVAVRWAWLSFPLGLLVAGHIFLLGTIWQTRRLRVQPWKGHRIPLLLARLDDSVAEIAAQGLDTRKGLEERVGHIKVRLEYDDRDRIAFKRVV